MAIVTGTDGDDRYPRDLEGTDAADQIFGLAGNDVLIGFGGDDVLEGGAGADQLFGSNGFDLASYQGSTAGVTVSLQPLNVAYGDAAGDQLYSIEGLVGSAFTDNLRGDDQRNILRGGGGGDELYGRGGADQLNGGDGNDHLNGGAGDDALNGGAGDDTATFTDGGVSVYLKDGYSQGGEAHGRDLLSGIENVVGSSSEDLLAGTDGANVLTGRGGADVLVGNGGADRFFYQQRSDSTPAAPDVLRDFSRAQGDRIDLRGVDADEQEGPADQAFQFVGQAQFTGAGQLRFFQAGGDTFVEANTTDATGGAELTIRIDPLVAFQATDFLL